MNKKRIRIIIAILFLAIAGAVAVIGWQYLFKPNVSLPEGVNEQYINIPTGSDYNSLVNILDEQKLIKNKEVSEIIKIFPCAVQ